MGATRPFSNYSKAFQTSQARCGNTGYQSTTSPPLIASMIYNTCTLSTGQTITNPNLGGVALHETGHAFDFSIAAGSANKSIPPSSSKAFRSLVNSSTNTPTAASDLYYIDHGNSQNGNQPLNTCGLYDSVSISGLEQDLGLPTANTTPVCTGSTENSPYIGKTNSQIATNQDPYFVNPPPTSIAYEDIFAELFAVRTGNIGSPAPLPFFDHWAPSGLHCSYLAVQLYYDTQQPPTSSQLSANDCPVPASGTWNSQ